MNYKIHLYRTVIFTASLFLLFSMAQAQKVKKGLFIGLNVTNNNFNPEGFDGTKILVGTSAPFTTFSVPELSPATGIGASLGYRGKDGSIEINYTSYNHEGKWLSFSGDATNAMLSINLKKYFLRELRLQPFIQAGWIPLATLTVADAGVIPVTLQKTDARYQGDIGSFQVGGGAAFYWTERFGVHGTVLYRYTNFGSVEDDNGATFEPENPINGTGWNAGISLTYTLL
ncbi:MAG: hypothetical protein R3C61_24560 [Bacteroidia bacterium]